MPVGVVVANRCQLVARASAAAAAGSAAAMSSQCRQCEALVAGGLPRGLRAHYHSKHASAGSSQQSAALPQRPAPSKLSVFAAGRSSAACEKPATAERTAPEAERPTIRVAPVSMTLSYNNWELFTGLAPPRGPRPRCNGSASSSLRRLGCALVEEPPAAADRWRWNRRRRGGGRDSCAGAEHRT